MERPPLLILESPKEYRQYYEKHYCRGEIYTFDNIRVFFSSTKFGHAFYENSAGRKGAKDSFSDRRAQRMSWVAPTLENPDAELFVGWNKDQRCYQNDRRVSVVYEDFVVIIQVSLDKRVENKLKANFVTCYTAEKRSMGKIRKSPLWDRGKCLEYLGGKDCR